MAKPLQTSKQSVKLAKDGSRVSRIRRDPPPVAKKVEVRDRDELDRRNVAVGVIAFTLAIMVAVVGLGSWMGWTPRQYTLEIDDRGGY